MLKSYPEIRTFEPKTGNLQAKKDCSLAEAESTTSDYLNSGSSLILMDKDKLSIDK